MSEIPKTSPEVSEKLEPIEPLRLRAVNSIREKVKSTLTRLSLLTVLGGVVGGVVGDQAQDFYRDKTGYNPSAITALENPESTEEIPSGRPKKDSEEVVSWRERAQRALENAKKWTGKKAESLAEKSELFQEAKAAQMELRQAYNNLLEFGDKTAFWLPFLMTFLATTMLTNKLIKVKKDLFEDTDPIVAKNLEAIERKINELIDRANQGENIRPEDVQNLLDQYFEESPDLETAMTAEGSGEGKEAAKSRTS